MRRLLVTGLVLGLVIIVGCETKSPVHPESNTPTTSVATTSTISPGPPTTPSTTTTTIVLGNLARRYQAFNPPPNVPADMTLFFELIQSGAAVRAGRRGFGSGVVAAVENEYKVTGVYVMGNGTTGTVTGELGGSSNPLETGGEFEGTLTASTPSGCTAAREFAGALTSQTLQWSGGAPGTSTCSPSPLSFPSISMLRFDPAAPLPTPPTPPSTTTTTTTTSVACSYSLSPASGTVASGGGPAQVTITTAPGCAWSAQSFADWITVQPPAGGAGPATVTYVVQPTTAQRTGNLLIAGIQFTVTQTSNSENTTTTSSTSSTSTSSTSTTSSSSTTTSVIPVPQISVSPDSGISSTTFVITATQFTPNGQAVRHWIVNGGPDLITTVTMNSNGGGTFNFTSSSGSNNEVWYVDVATGFSSNHVTFTVD